MGLHSYRLPRPREREGCRDGSGASPEAGADKTPGTRRVDIPRKHPRLGALSPAVDAVAEALKGRDAIRLQASGAYAAHLLGLTDQVPMRIVYLTDGPTRQIALGGREIRLKRTTPRGMATAGRISGTVFQALRWLGKEHVDDAVVRGLRERLSESDKQTLMEDIRYVPAWVAEVFRAIVHAGE